MEVLLLVVWESAARTSRQLVTSGRSRSSLRRSRSVIPPQTPHSMRLSRASARQRERTAQSVQILRARLYDMERQKAESGARNPYPLLERLRQNGGSFTVQPEGPFS